MNERTNERKNEWMNWVNGVVELWQLINTNLLYFLFVSSIPLENLLEEAHVSMFFQVLRVQVLHLLFQVVQFFLVDWSFVQIRQSSSLPPLWSSSLPHFPQTLKSPQTSFHLQNLRFEFGLEFQLVRCRLLHLFHSFQDFSLMWWWQWWLMECRQNMHIINHLYQHPGPPTEILGPYVMSIW